MAISTMDALIAALPGQHRHFQKASMASKAAGTWQSLWLAAGQPAAGATPATGAGAVPTSASAGAIPFTNPAGGNFSYLGKLAAALGVAGTLILYDRLWANSGLSGTVTSAQTIGSAALTRPDALGDDTELWVEWYTATGASAVNITGSYTNQGGTAGQVLPSQAFMVSPVAGQMQPLYLGSGDTGVRAVASVTLSATTSTAGNFGLTILRRLAEIPLTLANVGVVLDALALGMPRIYDSACLALMVQCSTTTTGVLQAALDIPQG